MDAVKEAGSLGIAENDVYNFKASESGVKLMYNIVSEVVSEKRSMTKGIIEELPVRRDAR